MMEARGWTQDDLAAITGRSRQSISEIVSGKNGIVLDMAVLLAAAFGNQAEEWLNADYRYRLSMTGRDVTGVRLMAELYAAAPVRDMMKRGWIEVTSDADQLRNQLKAFFDSDPLEAAITFPIAAKRTVKLLELSTAEKAWCFRAKQLAKSLLVNQFSLEGAKKAQTKLRRLAAHPKEAYHVPEVLGEHGIRFVVVEPIPDVKVDGAAFWDEAGPIIALSLRHDRVDGFWFTLMHELAHIRNGDPLSVDAGMVDSVRGITVSLVNDDAETRANQEAAAALVPKAELESFIARVGPHYPRERIIQFANRMRIHPGIIVGQLQNRQEIGYMAFRDVLVKIRETVISTSLTDGWGHSITPCVASKGV